MVMEVPVERRSKAEVVGKHQERLIGERIDSEGRARPGEMDASHKTNIPHIRVRKYAEEEE